MFIQELRSIFLIEEEEIPEDGESKLGLHGVVDLLYRGDGGTAAWGDVAVVDEDVG
jgi:hypothetical protein